MMVLVACEYSGRVRDAFAAKGHSAYSCDIVPTDSPGHHFQCDVQVLLSLPWDLVIAFPPCTRLSCIGVRNWPKWQADGSQNAAIEFFMQFTRLTHVSRVAIENPAGVMSSRYRKPDQYVQPWWFGEPWTKRTGLWLKGLPRLVATNPVEPKGPWVGDQTSSKHVNRRQRTPEGSLEVLGGTWDRKSRSKARSTTFLGIAQAMADQWGSS